MYKINLLPTELQKDLSIDIKGLIRRVTVTVIVILLLCGYGAFLYMGFLTQREITDTEKYLNQISATVKKVEGIKTQRLKNEESTKKFKELLSARLTRFPMIEDLSYNMPVDLWLDNVEMSYVDPKDAAKSSQTAKTPANGSTGAAQGQAAVQPQAQGQAGTDKKEPASPHVPNTLVIEGYSRTVPSVGIFMNNLYRMPYFTSVVLNELTTEEKSGNTKFKLTAVLREDGH